MQRHARNGLEWLEFDLLAGIEALKHAVFLRQGGQSQGYFNGLNTSFDVGDVKSAVQANLARIQLEISSGKLFWAKQCHGTHIAHIQNNSSQESSNCDALATQERNLTLLIKHADCQATIFYDPINHAVANVHAGWRGSVLNIYANTIAWMQKRFGSKPSELLVCISPSLGPQEAEFIYYQKELPEEFWQFQVRPNYFDFWAISQHQLQQAGILAHHIETACISTYPNPQDYFSYRRDKITGRHATCVTLL
jgi:YfiH family protein